MSNAIANNTTSTTVSQHRFALPTYRLAIGTEIFRPALQRAPERAHCVLQGGVLLVRGLLCKYWTAEFRTYCWSGTWEREARGVGEGARCVHMRYAARPCALLAQPAKRLSKS